MSLNLTAAEAALFTNEAYVFNYLSVAASSVIIFDYVLTVSQETSVVWGRKWTAATILFIANRVLAVVFAASLIIQPITSIYATSCQAITIFNLVAELSLTAVWAVFNAIRTYAVGRRARVAASTVFLISSILVATNIYFICVISAGVQTFGDVDICWVGLSPSAHDSTALEILGRSSQILADILVIAVTWWTTYRVKLAARSAGVATPLVTLLLRDGTIYFIVLLLVNAVQLGAWVATDSGIDLFPITAGLTSIIVSRFLLNLYQVENEEVQNVTAAASCASEMQFSSSFIRGMGAEVNYSFGLDADSGSWDDDTLGEEAGETDGGGANAGTAGQSGMVSVADDSCGQNCVQA